MRELTGSSAPLTLLVGDSGTGKSSILAELQERSVDAVAPAPVQVKRAPGSLQVALLEGLGAAVALRAVDVGATHRIGQVLTDAANRVVDLRVKDLRSAVGRHLLSVVRARVGDEIADLLEDFATSLGGATSDALSARITAASDNDVVKQIASFSFEVAELADGNDVYLALDDTDRLDDADLSRLADLLDELSPKVKIRASFSTWHATSRARSERLLIGGAFPVLVSACD